MDAESKSLLKNIVNVTTKYKNKLSAVKSRLWVIFSRNILFRFLFYCSREQIERKKCEAQNTSEQFQIEIERLKDELTYKKETIFEKEKLIQDVQYKNLEILLERQSVEERVSSNSKRLNEFVYKYVTLLIDIEIFYSMKKLESCQDILRKMRLLFPLVI
jgi:hypothetical protein